MNLDSCIHIANLFYAASYLCRDILWLRVWTCCGLVFAIAFFCSQSQVMFAPASWMTLFLFVNVVQIGRVIGERKQMKLTPRQERVGSMMLNHLSRNDLLNILTKSMCENRTQSKLLEQCSSIQLNEEQQIVRKLAFEHLSDGELVNLVVRRFWRSIRRRNPGQFFRAFQRRSAASRIASAGS